MFKKAIAGVLSAVVCASTLLCDAPLSSRNTAETGEQVPAASGDAQPDMGLTGSNSLARYLAKQGTEQAASQPAAQPLKASAADAVFAVTNLDFDRETGIIQVTSTQSEAVTLRVSFIDEDSPANVYTVEYGAGAGEYVHSTFSADTSLLPEYFTVSVQLVGRAGLPLCKTFELKTYTREMQKIIEKDTSDFAEEQVVNLDADETTNFIVLSEDTVRAETTDEHNILVSADYDQNIYVFDHIDDSIRSLEEGQYFYIQPTDDDIISTDIQEIVIDGDTATITGSGEIDDMFDFIKIEIDTAQLIESDGESDLYEDTEAEETLESDRSYLGVSAQTIDSEDAYEQRLKDLKQIDPNLELTQYKKKTTIKRDFKTPGGHFIATPAITIDTTVKWNLYKSFGYINLFFVCDTKLSATITGKAKVSTPSSTGSSGSSGSSGTENSGSENSGSENSGSENSEDEPEELPESVASDPAGTGDGEKDNSPKHLIKIPLASAGAADIYAFIDIGLTLAVEGKVGFEKKFTKGFAYDSDNGFEKIDFDTSPVLLSADIKASLTLDIKVGFEVSALKGLVTASVAGGLKVTASATVQLIGEQTDNKTFNKTGTNVFKPDPETEELCIHADEKCIKVEITFKVYVELKVTAGLKFKDSNKLFKQLNKLRFEKTYTYETDEIFGHKMPKFVLFCSYNSAGINKGWSFNFFKVEHGQSCVCPHQAYRVTFLIDFQNAPAGTEANLQIDGNTYTLTPDSPAKLVLYAVPKTSYTYYINVDGQRKISDSFGITNGSKIITHLIYWPAVESGTAKPKVGDKGTEDGPAITTAAQTTTTETEPEYYDYSHLIPSGEMIMKDNKEYDLGEHITGMFSNEGTFSVFGYGDMYANASIPSSVRSQITRIVFYDQDPEENLTINNIADSLFASAKNLEVVYMPEALTAIGSSAFNGCTSLKWLRYGGGGDTSATFELPETLTTIGGSAFFNCSAAELGDLDIPDSVTFIGNSAFEGCLKLTSVSIPDSGITELRQHVFQNCTALKEVYFGPGVTCTDTQYCHWFHGCTAIEKLTIPTYIFGTQMNTLDDLFNGGSSGVPATLTEVTVSSGTVIPASYFAGLKYLEKVNYPGNTEEIGNNAFSGCTALRSAALPNTLTTIGNNAFLNCSAADFGDLVIPESVTLIGSSAFDGCSKITSVTVPDSEGTSLMQHVFQNCVNLKQAYFGIGTTCPDTQYCHWFHSSPALEKLTIPAFDMGETHSAWNLNNLFNGGNSGVSPTLRDVTVLTGTVIPSNYFSGLTQLKHIVYPDEVTEIGKSAFNGCTNLIALEPLSTCGDPTVGGTADPDTGDLIIPETVTLIGTSAFTNCLKIRTLTVPGNTAIMQHAFENCTGLQEAYFGAGVNCPDTQYCHWFHGCTSVEKLVLPAYSFGPKMNTLSDLFSSNATNVPKTLTDVTVTDGTVIPKNYFNGIGTLSAVTFSAALETVEASAFKGCTALAEANLIGEDADWDNVDITVTDNQPLLALVRKGRFSVILADPRDEVVEEDRTAEFTVYAASKDNLSYLWQYSTDGGSNWWSMDCLTSKLTFKASKEQNGYLYHCTVIDRNGYRQTSADAKLTVTDKTLLPEAKLNPENPSEQTGQNQRDPKTLPGYKPGDANGDSSIDVSDAVLIARFAVGDVTATVKDIGVINGDVNGDGNTDIQDVTIILMYIAKRIKAFPVSAT